MKNKKKSAKDYLSASGPLAEKLTGFNPRAAQKEMASAIEQAIESKKNLVCEAPTGVGKTYAYLIPLLLAKGKAIISTASKTLQNQLFHRDLPLLLQHSDLKRKVVLLKGRGNYLCLYRLENSFIEQISFDRKMATDFQTINSWAAKTKTGDIAECGQIDESAPIWPHVTSTADNCLAKECPLISQCYLFKARKKAQEGDLIVVNHHLLFAQHQIIDEGISEFLPIADSVLLDEAHQAPEIAAQFFSESMSTAQFVTLVKDIEVEQQKEANDMADLLDSGQDLLDKNTHLQRAFLKNESKGIWQDLTNQAEIQRAITEVREQLSKLVENLEEASVRSKGLEKCYERSVLLLQRFERLFAAQSGTDIHWYEIYSRSIQVHLTPIEIAKSFQSFAKKQAKHWVFTSATISTNGRFDFFKTTLGLDNDCKELILASPFNYSKQALFYLPRYLPAPNSGDYLQGCLKAALPVIKATKGRAFLLFTSHRALAQAAVELKNEDFPLFVQGDANRNVLLEQFVSSKNGILLGTNSFWEGVDIRGQALFCVIIDKLPFGSPADPVHQARLQHYVARGQDPFKDYQLPKAVISLKQGAGRLIRAIDDHGILMVCDQRLLSKPYGQAFLQSLPSFRRTRELNVVCEAIASWSSS